MSEKSKRILWLYNKSSWIFLGVFGIGLFGILYQYPVLGFFNKYPGQVIKYILILNLVYIVTVAVFVYSLFNGKNNNK